LRNIEICGKGIKEEEKIHWNRIIRKEEICYTHLYSFLISLFQCISLFLPFRACKKRETSKKEIEGRKKCKRKEKRNYVCEAGK
jgi:hypothetical protein